MKRAIGVLLIGLLAVPGLAALITGHQDTSATGAVVDGVLSPGEYGNGAYSYVGGGTGFGGTLGAGVLYFDSDASNLYIGFQPGNNLNDNVAIMLDTRAGGFRDADMNDTADGGRMAVSNQAVNADDAYPVLPDFGIVIGSFGIVAFELTAGNTPGHLIYVPNSYSGQFTGNAPTFREYALPLGAVGARIPVPTSTCIGFFAAYVSDGGYGSNESIPASAALNAGPNLGFDTFSPGYDNYDQFCTFPEPASLLALVALAGLIRRR